VHTLRRVGGNVKRHDFQGKFLCLEGISALKRVQYRTTKEGRTVRF
jgi:hypothetical protein